ncbi:MAG: hypothetical protein P8Y76_15440 [bacterium]
MIRSLPEWVRPMLVPGGILVAAALLAAVDPALPPSLAGLRTIAPYVVLGLAGAVTLWFNRGRAFAALDRADRHRGRGRGLARVLGAGSLRNGE